MLLPPGSTCHHNDRVAPRDRINLATRWGARALALGRVGTIRGRSWKREVAVATDDDVTMWLRYAERLAAMIRPPAGEAVQVTTPSTPWDWGGQSPPPGSLPYAQWSLLNVVPSNPQEQTNSNAAAGGSGFDRSYKVWMNSLAVGDLQSDHHYQTLQSSADQTRRQYTADYRSAQAQWRREAPSGTPNFHDWLADPAQLALTDQINTDKQAVANTDQQLQQYVQQIEAPTKDILAA